MSLSPIQKQRHITLEGTTNLRNLGGYITDDGSQSVRWGVLYRSDMLADVPLAAAEETLVRALHITDTYDLRDPDEVAAKTYAIPGITRHSFAVQPSVMADFIATGQKFTKEITINLFLENYRQFVTTFAPHFGRAIRAIIAQRPNSATSAALVHCTAGKDRTGITCYLILSLLGVREEDKLSDYLATNDFFKIPAHANTYMGGLGLDEESANVMWFVRTEFLDVAKREFESAGGVERYAIDKMGLTREEIQALRDCLLEKRAQ